MPITVCAIIMVLVKFSFGNKVFIILGVPLMLLALKYSYYLFKLANSKGPMKLMTYMHTSPELDNLKPIEFVKSDSLNNEEIETTN